MLDPTTFHYLASSWEVLLSIYLSAPPTCTVLPGRMFNTGSPERKDSVAFARGHVMTTPHVADRKQLRGRHCPWSREDLGRVACHGQAAPSWAMLDPEATSTCFVPRLHTGLHSFTEKGTCRPSEGVNIRHVEGFVYTSVPLLPESSA